MASLNISGCGEREWRCRDRHYCVHQVAIRLVMISPSSRGEICQCRQCRRQCKIFASGVNFPIFTHFLCFFFLLKLLKLDEIDSVKFLAWKSVGLNFPCLPSSSWPSSSPWSTWSGLAMRRRPRLPGREWRGGRALPQWLQRPPVQMQQWTVSRMRIMLMMTIMTILIVMIKMIIVTRLIGFRAAEQLVSIYAFEYQNIDSE